MAERLLPVFRSEADDDKTRDKEALIWTNGQFGAGSWMRILLAQNGIVPIDDGEPPPVRRTELLQGSREMQSAKLEAGGVTESSSHSLTESRNHPMDRPHAFHAAVGSRDCFHSQWKWQRRCHSRFSL